jgi:predicted NBD/HSP70 family sugar kinase
MTAGIGLDIGGTKTLGVVVDDQGVIRASIHRLLARPMTTVL